jgi:AbrB family looped-hinge helix DNA binding protein
VTHAEVEVNQQGRVTIPAQIRRDLDLHAGSRLVATVEDGRLVLEERSRLLARYQVRLAEAAKASGKWSGRVVDSLLADRRAEAGKEKTPDERADG